MKAQAPDAGKLREAATQKNDQDILLHINEKDCSCIEVRYHKQCCNQYTNMLFRKASEDSSKLLYEEIFCEMFIEQRIIRDEEKPTVTELFKEFINMVQMVEKKDVSNYKKYS